MHNWHSYKLSACQMDTSMLHPLTSLSSAWVRNPVCDHHHHHLHHLSLALHIHQSASFPMRLEPDFDLSPPEVSGPLWCVLFLLTTEPIVDDSNPSGWWGTREWVRERWGAREWEDVDEKYSPEWYKAGHRDRLIGAPLRSCREPPPSLLFLASDPRHLSDCFGIFMGFLWRWEMGPLIYFIFDGRCFKCSSGAKKRQMLSLYLSGSLSESLFSRFLPECRLLWLSVGEYIQVIKPYVTLDHLRMNSAQQGCN